MTSAQVISGVQEVQAAGDSILAVLEGADPEVEVPAEAAAITLNLVGGMVTKALQAFSAASGEPITSETVMGLLPDAMPLDPPDEA
jgi:hypothetical protein